MPAEPRRRLYFDANVFIYALESDSHLGVSARRWLEAIDIGEVDAITSEITLAEVLPHPIETGDGELANAYRSLFEEPSPLISIPVGRGVVLRAAELRARMKIPLPDAIHVATALDHGCSEFVTEDDRLRVPPPISKLLLSASPNLL